MKILMIAPYFAPYIGVGAARITSLSEYLADNGWEVIAVCFDPKCYKADECTRRIPNNVRYVYFERAEKWADLLWDCVQDILAKEKIEICLHTVGPFDFMKYIYKVKIQKGIPYVIDYRDPWLLDKSVPDLDIPFSVKMKIGMRTIIDRPIEKRVIKHAAGIVCVTDLNTRCVSECYNSKQKTYTIWNGFEKNDSEQKVSFIESTYSIVVAGKMAYYNFEKAKCLIDVVDQLRKEGTDISIYHIGFKEENIIKYCMNNCISEHTYVFCGKKSYEETMGAIANATACYIAYAHYYSVGTKVYDYIAKNKPIIYSGVVPSALADFVSSFKYGFVANDEKSLICCMRKIIDEDIKCLDDNISIDYSREHQNQRYSKLLQTLVWNEKKS